MSGIQRIAEERKRQLNEKGWSFEHDRGHIHGELATAAAVLALDDSASHVIDEDGEQLFDVWGMVAKHAGAGNYSRRLEIAGALIAAEIDRMEYLEGQQL